MRFLNVNLGLRPQTFEGDLNGLTYSFMGRDVWPFLEASFMLKWFIFIYSISFIKEPLIGGLRLNGL